MTKAQNNLRHSSTYHENKLSMLLSNYCHGKSTVIVGDCEVSLCSSSQQPPEKAALRMEPITTNLSSHAAQPDQGSQPVATGLLQGHWTLTRVLRV